VVFTYAPGRGGLHAERILQGFGGILQVPSHGLQANHCRATDGYAGYNRLIAAERTGSSIQLAYCWAHARRKLIEINRAGLAPIAEEGVALIRKLYAIEAEIRGKDPLARLAARQDRAAPILTRLDEWLRHHRARASAKSPLGEALAYIVKYRDGLGRFLTDGRIEIDNNTVERIIRPIALNRKNALFAGHDAGAENWAVIASLIETCKMNDIDPHAWLANTLNAIVNGHKQSQIDDLLPWNYAVTV
jgi:transposase